MSDIAVLVRRTERLQEQAEVLRRELVDLRQELLQLGAETNEPKTAAVVAKTDCLAVAMDLAQDLGPEFSSERPHELAV